MPRLEYDQFEPREFIVQDDFVAVVVFEQGRVKATGVTFDNLYIHVFKFAQGKVTQIRDSSDMVC